MENIQKKIKLSDFAEINRMAVWGYFMLSIFLDIFAITLTIKGKESIIFLVVFLLLLNIPLIIGSLKCRQDKEFKYIMDILGIGYAIFYTYCVFTNCSTYAFIFVMPLLIIVMAYSNLRFSAICGIGTAVVNILNDAYTAFKSGSYDFDNGITKIIILCFTAAFILSVSYLLSMQNNRKLQSIEKEKQNVCDLLDKILSASESITNVIGNVSDEMLSLEDSVKNTCESMKEVSKGTDNTAQSVDMQMSKTQEISSDISEVDNVSIEVIDSIDKVKKEIERGQINIDSLVKGVDKSEVSSANAKRELQNLSDYTSKMQKIIEVIDNITSETSMLALNASIEAARAGEQGKGFSVVASEISKLAEQTKDATVNINNLIQNVSNELDVVLEVIKELIDGNLVQNTTSKEIAGNFSGIFNNVANIADLSSNLSAVIGKLNKNNSLIMDSIKDISETTREVSKHSDRTYEISNNNSLVVDKVKELVDELKLSSDELMSCYNSKNNK